jgi:hypothetical protein
MNNAKPQSYIMSLTIGTLGMIIKADLTQDFLCHIYVACNFVGIFYLLVHSVIQRRKLASLKQELDKDKDTPSDYALLLRNVPRTWTQKMLKEYIEKEFAVINEPDNWQEELKKELKR